MRFLFAALILVLSFAAPASAQMVDTLAKNAYIVDFETGQILLEKDGDERMPTSSMSKTMTMYLVFEGLKSGKLTLDQELPVSEKAWSTQGSKMFVPINAMVKVEDLIRGVIVQSGNDATVVLAEGMAGNEGEFAAALNAKAKELGMMNSNFVNASGWPDPDHYSTCHDLTILAKALIQNFPEQYKYYAEKDFTYNNIKQGNRNPLLYVNIGADGIKTGHAEEAGYGLMGSAVRDGRRVIMVLNGMASMEERAAESTRLMEWALATFANKNILHAGMKVAEAPVVMGMERSVPLIVEQDLKVTVPKMNTAGGATANAVFKGPIEAPITKGQQVGVVRVTVPNMDPMELPIVAAKDIPRKGFFPALLEKTERLVFGDRVSPSSVSTPVTPVAEPAPVVVPAPVDTPAPVPAPVSAPAPQTTTDTLPGPAPVANPTTAPTE